MNYDFAAVMAVYEGSNGEATKTMYDALEQIGPAGHVAVNVFRAVKSSARAKVYRGGGYRGMAYDRKQWAMDNLCKALAEHGAAIGIGFGWGIDDSRTGDDPFRHVLYVDLPTGQVSFHTRSRGDGPDYPGQWDGVRHAGPERICRWIAALFEDAADAVTAAQRLAEIRDHPEQLITGDELNARLKALCSDCPPEDYPTDKTRCNTCPRRQGQQEVDRASYRASGGLF